VKADDISIKRFLLEMTDYWQTREWQEKLQCRNESACPGNRLGGGGLCMLENSIIFIIHSSIASYNLRHTEAIINCV
jgi:hypothetical protein